MTNPHNGPDQADDSPGSRLFGKVGMAIVIEVLAGLVIGFLALGGEDKPIYEPPAPPESTYEPVLPDEEPSQSPFPTGPEAEETTTDAVAVPEVGDCFTNEGTTDVFALESSSCDPGAFEVADVYSGGDTDDCDGVPRSLFSHDPGGGGAILCLTYLHPWGDAYYAEPGECVTLLDDGAYAITDCDPGDYQVLERFWGEEGSYDCSEWEYYNGSVDLPGYIDAQDLLLCMRIVYPDDIGFADVDTCMYASGADDDMHFAFADCSQSNVYVTGRTSDYEAYDFCNGYGWSTWQSTAFPDHSYTVCWAWL